jgi:hypothetical protein
MRCGSEEGSYLRLVDFCITHLQAESNKEEEEGDWGLCFRKIVPQEFPLWSARLES